jgi:hypothetical protein
MNHLEGNDTNSSGESGDRLGNDEDLDDANSDDGAVLLLTDDDGNWKMKKLLVSPLV